MTPTEFRSAYELWARTAPTRDSDIFPDKARTEVPRHAGLCIDLKPMLAWRALHDSVDPLATNFLQHCEEEEITLVDGSKERRVRDPDSEWEIRPTVHEMLALVADVEFQVRPDGRKVPVGGEIDFGEVYHSERYGDLQPISRLGGLMFAQSDHDSRLGSLTYWRAGKYWSNPIDRSGTPKMAKRPPPPEQMRFNQEDGVLAREELSFANDNLAPHDVDVLDTAIISQNFRAIGERFGHRGKTAERQGKQLVQRATKNLAALSEKLAA